MEGVASEVEEDVKLFDEGAVKMKSFSSCQTAASLRVYVHACVCAYMYVRASVH